MLVAMFMVHCLEKNLTDSYNLVRQPMQLGDFLESCVRVTDRGTRLTWVPADFLAEHKLQSWRDLQMWADSNSPISGSLTWSSSKALDAGLTIRPLDDTIRDTIAWFRTLPEDRQANLKSGLDPEKEAEVLQAWKASQKS